MAITYFNSASTPADNGTNTATTTAVTPPSSMVAGDLVILYTYQRGTSTTMSISATGGQTWNIGPAQQGGTATLSVALFWCRYNGTWGADPSVLFSAGTNTNVVMHVFRPSVSANLWAVDTGIQSGGLTNSFSAAATISNTLFGSQSTTKASTVCFSAWATDDDNTWSTLTGSGWVVTGGTQYRNTSGSDVSSTYAHNIQTSIGTPATPAKTQATLGNDPGIVCAICFYESQNRIPRPSSIGHPFIV